MKNNNLVQLVFTTLLLLVISHGNTYAAFSVKQDNRSAAAATAFRQQGGLVKYKQLIQSLSKSSVNSLFSRSTRYPESNTNRGEVWGILSIFSCLTIVLAPLGIIFGGIGIYKNHKNGAAIVGLILGVVVTIGILIFLSTWQLTLA